MKSAILTLPVLLTCVALPLIFSIFAPQWYTYNCQYHQRCERFGLDGVTDKVTEMGDFFLTGNPLSKQWSKKERQHLSEVRDMYKILTLMTLVSIALVIAAYFLSPSALSNAALINVFIVIACLGVLPFFASFWRDVFHPLLFDNDLWKNNSSDISWYLMPRIFFRNTVILIISVSIASLLSLWFLSRKRHHKQLKK